MLLANTNRLTSARAEPPCDNWTLHTRTLPEICPEVILDNLTAQGIASIWGLAFDEQNNLYFVRPATGQIMQMRYHDGHFDPPQVVADGLDFPQWIVCPAGRCTPRQTPSELGGIDFADFSQSPADKTLWYSAHDAVMSERGRVALSRNSSPAGIVFYQGAAFPKFQNGLLVVTSGSCNTPLIAGYELLFIPFDAQDNPGTIQRLIPANTERSSADAALAELSFFPDHPVSVAVDNNGWIYVGVREGRIIRLRPR